MRSAQSRAAAKAEKEAEAKAEAARRANESQKRKSRGPCRDVYNRHTHTRTQTHAVNACRSCAAAEAETEIAAAEPWGCCGWLTHATSHTHTRTETSHTHSKRDDAAAASADSCAQHKAEQISLKGNEKEITNATQKLCAVAVDASVAAAVAACSSAQLPGSNLSARVPCCQVMRRRQRRNVCCCCALLLSCALVQLRERA